MLDAFFNSQKLLLDPMERISEVLFGLIVVPTAVHHVLPTTAGCNLGWGAIDASLSVRKLIRK